MKCVWYRRVWNKSRKLLVLAATETLVIKHKVTQIQLNASSKVIKLHSKVNEAMKDEDDKNKKRSKSIYN